MVKYYQGIIDRYSARLPIEKPSSAVTLLEGNTPLIPLRNILKKYFENAVPEISLYAKYEGVNPTGSFKDRGMTVAVTQALESGSRAVICASTGNTSASAAAYAARAGLKSFVLIPVGKIALGKLAQAMMHGAVVIQVMGDFDQAMQLVKSVGDQSSLTIVNSINPFRIEGQKTAAFEVIDRMGCAPDYHCLPVGNAGNITAYWKGYQEYFAEGLIEVPPKMLGYQAAGAAPLVHGRPIANPETVATAIRIGHPQSWEGAVAAVKESKGWFRAISDEDILRTQQWLASTEGIFCEPASAIAVAGLFKDIQAGKVGEGSICVCTLTGHGLKDPDIAIRQAEHQPKTVECDEKAIRSILLEHL